ncbi:hypothetical protein Tsubulata_046690 [Turnera subulata]|uniref:Uncharacterized protein n=1 Tax=Turnera subulata TaxID=218843 RepID=A0A9Q0FEZ0_9ROSI|nr:hypothetical protein Tsubulata_046690 [Turnera subulata]
MMSDNNSNIGGDKLRAAFGMEFQVANTDVTENHIRNFTWMFLVDGCALLYFSWCLMVEDRVSKKVGLSRTQGKQRRSSRNMAIPTNILFGVTELKASGAEFKRSKTNSLVKAISFRPRWLFGTVRLSLLRISDDSVPTFLNLIAYEMCPDFMNEYEAISYICFLDSLTNELEDVLRKAHNS